MEFMACECAAASTNGPWKYFVTQREPFLMMNMAETGHSRGRAHSAAVAAARAACCLSCL